MATERDMNLNNAENTPSCTADTVKASFCAWLSSEQGKQTDANAVIATLNTASEQLQKRKIASVPIWEITKSAAFAVVYGNARDNKFFRILDKKNYTAFIRDGQLYLKFLKSKPQFQPVADVPDALPAVEQEVTENLTIKEAVVSVLTEARDAMTADDIYDAIIKRSLYSFGAQNPINVVRTTIEYACDNSGYSNRDALSCFHFEKNAAGKRVYSLLNAEQIESSETVSSIPDNAPKNPDGNLTIWDDKVEQAFQKWLENENYAQKTADNYRRATAQIFRSFATLAVQAVGQSESELEAVRQYIVLLNEDFGFVEANATRHNQFTAAMAALERFYSAGVEIAEHEGDEQMTYPLETITPPTSSLGNIVDLEEGKEGLREILEAHFQTLYGYSNISIVWNAAQDNLSLFLNDNAINTADELWRFMYRVFLGEYVMSNPHIWKTQPNYPQSYVGVIINLARQFGGTVTREQINEYFVRIKQGSQINANIIRSGHLAFYAPKHFILTEIINLSGERIAAITKALDRLFERERVSYIVLRDISDDWFSSLSTLKGNLNWTALLLQEVLRLRPAIGYRTVFSGLNGQAYDTLGAAIVPSKSEINCFADVAHRYCHENKFLGKKMLTEDLRIILRDAGMLEGNELIYNLHKALRDYRFAFTDENSMVKILER
jgi:hypothetical protein